MKNTISLLLLYSFFSSTLLAQIKTVSDTSINGDVVFEKVEVEASYPGGNQAWSKFLSKKLDGFSPADYGAPTGRYQVMVKFIVDKDGSTSYVEALTNFGYKMEPTVINAIQSSGLWTPATRDGRPLKAYRKQPVTFLVEDDSYSITSKIPYVLFTGTDNLITVEVSKKIREVALTISGGTITEKGDGQYIVRVNKSGYVVIDIADAKRNKKIGAASFEVKKALIFLEIDFLILLNPVV